MTALLIIGCIIVTLGILLSFSLTFYVTIVDEVCVKLGAFGYKKQINLDEQLDPKKIAKKLKKQEKKEARAKRRKQAKIEKAQKKKKSRQKSQAGDLKAKVVTENTFGETVELILALLKSSLLSTATLLRHVRITKLSIYMTVCDESADKTAIQYGQVSMGVYNLLAQLDHFMTLKIKSIDIVPDFVGDEEFYDIYFKVKLRFNYIVGAFFSILFKLLVNIVKIKVDSREK